MIKGYAGECMMMGLEEMYKTRCNMESVDRLFANNCTDRGSVV